MKSWSAVVSNSGMCLCQAGRMFTFILPLLNKVTLSGGQPLYRTSRASEIQPLKVERVSARSSVRTGIVEPIVNSLASRRSKLARRVVTLSQDLDQHLNRREVDWDNHAMFCCSSGSTSVAL